jgi:meso-butanediol dehydrogenase/(S,S)-butanediol dehydrogenase/diacetyl reductase
MIRFATSKFGRLDILHNHAIFTTVGRIADTTLEGWQKTVDVGLTAYWDASKIALEHAMLPQRRGAIVNTASVSGLAGDYTLGAYNAVKAGVVNITRVTGIEYARKRIRCNAPYAPGRSRRPRCSPSRGAPAGRRAHPRGDPDGASGRAAGDRQRGIVPRVRRGLIRDRRVSRRRGRVVGAFGDAKSLG